MKRKDEDLLQRLAFGELSDAEAARLRQAVELSPEHKKALAGFEAMRDGLSEMRDVPEDQLSTERLREAVLSRGLKPRLRVTWLWGPALACALGVGIGFLRHTTHGPTDVRMTSSAANAGFDVAVNSPNPLAASVMPEELPAPNLSEIHSAAYARRHQRRVRRDKQEEPYRNWLAVTLNSDEPFGAEADRGADSPRAQRRSGGEQIVLITAGKDADSSVNNAREVDSGKNVLVGG